MLAAGGGDTDGLKSLFMENEVPLDAQKVTYFRCSLFHQEPLKSFEVIILAVQPIPVVVKMLLLLPRLPSICFIFV